MQANQQLRCLVHCIGTLHIAALGKPDETDAARPVDHHRTRQFADARLRTQIVQFAAQCLREEAHDVRPLRLALRGDVGGHHQELVDTVFGTRQWQEAGGSGTPPGLVNGKMSEAGLFKLLSQMRLGNPNWFNQVTTATEAGLLREIVMMQAMQLELTRKNNELLDRMSFITALDYLTRMDGTTGRELNDLYARMVGAQQ